LIAHQEVLFYSYYDGQAGVTGRLVILKYRGFSLGFSLSEMKLNNEVFQTRGPRDLKSLT